MNTPYNISSDFKKLPKFTFNFHPAVVGTMNGMMKLMRFFQKKKFQSDITYEYATSDDGYQVKLIIFRPKNLKKNAASLVYYHGGAFALTYGAEHLNKADEYAIKANCTVIFVEYRLSPKYIYPVGFNDCYSALKWTVKNASRLAIDQSRIAVSGDSAGGAMAIGVAMRSRDENLIKLCGQMLIYPVLDSSCSTQSATSFVDVPLWNAVSNKRMWAMYLSSLKNSNDEYFSRYVSPIDGELDDLPTAYIESAEFDPLRDEAHLLADKLKQRDQFPILNKTKGTVHGYDSVRSSQITENAMIQRIQFLKKIFYV